MSETGSLVLSLFPGIDIFGMGFEHEGFCVVRGPDLLWGGDIHNFHPAKWEFDGIIGGPPCKAHSLARGGKASREPDMVPEFVRCVQEADPTWWVMENVPSCPPPDLPCSNRIDLNARQLGMAQNRHRVFYSNITLHIEGVALENIDHRPCAATSYWKDGRQYGDKTARRFREVVVDQGLPKDFYLPPFKVSAKVEAVCNAVPLPMARAVARAVKEAVG